MSPDLTQILQDPHRISEIPRDAIPVLLGEFEQLRVQLWARMLAAESPRGNGPDAQAQDDRLLTAGEAASLLAVDIKWLYRHYKKLPFARQLSRKVLRFSETSLRRWLATRR